MDLLKGDERKVGSAESGLKTAAIFENVFARVPIGEAEVEDLFVIEIRRASGACGETVEKPAKFGEGRDLEELETAGGADCPGACG